MLESTSLSSNTPVAEMRSPGDKRRKAIAGSQPHRLSQKALAPLALTLGTVVMVIYALWEGSLSILMAYLVFGLLGSASVWGSESTPIRLYATVYGLASVAAVLLAWNYTSTYGVPYAGGGSDELFFEANGRALAARFGVFDYGMIKGNIVGESESTTGYIYLMGLLATFSEWFDGFHTMVPRLFNAMCLSLVAVISYQIGMRLQLQKRTAIAAALFAGGFPFLMWVSVQSLRDIVQALLLLLLVYLWLPDRNQRWRYPVPMLLLLTALLIIPVWEMRKPQAFVALFIIVFSFFANRRTWSPINMIFVTIPIAIAVVYAFHEYSTAAFQDIESYFELATLYTEYQAAGGSVGSVGLSALVFTAPLLPLGWAYRIAYALASPLPVAFYPLHFAWLSFGSIIQILFLPFLLLGIKIGLKDIRWRILVVSFILFFLAMAMFSFTIRHSTYWMVFAIPLAALGFERYRGSHRRVFLHMSFAGAVLGGLYLVFK